MNTHSGACWQHWILVSTVTLASPPSHPPHLRPGGEGWRCQLDERWCRHHAGSRHVPAQGFGPNSTARRCAQRESVWSHTALHPPPPNPVACSCSFFFQVLPRHLKPHARLGTPNKWNSASMVQASSHRRGVVRPTARASKGCTPGCGCGSRTGDYTVVVCERTVIAQYKQL